MWTPRRALGTGAGDQGQVFRSRALAGSLAAGEARALRVEAPVALSNRGGTISLVDERGLEVDGVAYTRDQARHPGWTLVF